MACDNQQYKWGCLSLNSPKRKMFDSLNNDRKCYKRKQTTNMGLVLPLYLTIVHLFLFANGDVFSKPRETHQGLGRMIYPPVGNIESEGSLLVGLFDGVHHHSFNQRQVKRAVPAQSVETLDRTLTSELPLPSLTNPGDKANAQAMSLSPVASENQNLPVQTENGTTKAMASNGSKDISAEEEGLGHGPPSGLKPDAMLRLFYVLVSIGVIALIYLLIKFLRFRKRRATKKYRVLAHTDDQEMFPLAADDGDDEEIFNAADHHTIK